MAYPFVVGDPRFQALIAHLQPVIPVQMSRISRHKFTPDEDDLLRTLVTQLGTQNWGLIAQHLRNRTPRQCRDRWKHYISPDVVVGNWTNVEDTLLVSKVKEMGPKWSAIARLFPGRTDIGVKNHYISITSVKKMVPTKQEQTEQEGA
jgi:hypothetical protein